ncbi:hypothetical protein KIPB_008355 [Kipferlia bialata]|uniref:Uncharacterized protein n=1 Tax=Kipferlia bialata TaxID=797122 RepID=A0A9K3GLD9_9EUKA|nr:hypothetical protein KIPB_008355 [Kipferlia bialata]|eukprot:g8355.t1
MLPLHRSFGIGAQVKQAFRATLDADEAFQSSMGVVQASLPPYFSDMVSLYFTGDVGLAPYHVLSDVASALHPDAPLLSALPTSHVSLEAIEANIAGIDAMGGTATSSRASAKGPSALEEADGDVYMQIETEKAIIGDTDLVPIGAAFEVLPRVGWLREVLRRVSQVPMFGSMVNPLLVRLESGELEGTSTWAVVTDSLKAAIGHSVSLVNDQVREHYDPLFDSVRFTEETAPQLLLDLLNAYVEGDVQYMRQHTSPAVLRLLLSGLKDRVSNHLAVMGDVYFVRNNNLAACSVGRVTADILDTIPQEYIETCLPEESLQDSPGLDFSSVISARYCVIDDDGDILAGDSEGGRDFLVTYSLKPVLVSTGSAVDGEGAVSHVRWVFSDLKCPIIDPLSQPVYSL